MTYPTKVMVVDDELEVVSLLTEWLEDDGYDVCSATEGKEALKVFFQHRPALTITDLRMPGMDGFQLIGRIRDLTDAHIVVLTALSDEEHMVRGLELGADDYLVKPVSRRALLAKVGSIFRRALPPGELSFEYSDPHLTLSFVTHETCVRGQLLHLRPTEFKLLACLVQNCDRVVGHQELLDRVWGNRCGSLDSLKWYISALREKVEEDPRNPRLILTLPRVGYRYNPPVAQAEAQRQQVGLS